MRTGTVKWFNDENGFGFIVPDEGGDDLFAHFSAINAGGRRSLEQGQRISFELVQVEEFSKAANIQLLQ